MFLANELNLDSDEGEYEEEENDDHQTSSSRQIVQERVNVKGTSHPYYEEKRQFLKQKR